MTAPSPQEVQVTEEPVLSVDAILQAVGNHFGVPPDAILCRRRDQRHTLPRHVAMYLCRDLLGWPYQRLAAAFCRDDHSTTMHGVRRVEARLAHDALLAARVEAIRAALPEQEPTSLEGWKARLAEIRVQRDAAVAERDALVRKLRALVNP